MRFLYRTVRCTHICQARLVNPAAFTAARRAAVSALVALCANRALAFARQYNVAILEMAPRGCSTLDDVDIDVAGYPNAQTQKREILASVIRRRGSCKTPHFMPWSKSRRLDVRKMPCEIACILFLWITPCVTYTQRKRLWRETLGSWIRD